MGKRICLLLGIGVLLVGAVAQAAERQNVLFIAVDDMRVELGCYGNTIARSPNIDQLAQTGTLFSRAYCQQAVCNPSRASLLTGLRLDTLNIWDLPTHFRQRRANVVTLPQLFKNNGYFTRESARSFTTGDRMTTREMHPPGAFPRRCTITRTGMTGRWSRARCRRI